MPRRTKADAEATRQSILDAAEQVFYQKGVARSSLELVAKQAGVTRGAVYWHFTNKADLFDAMLDRVRMPADYLLAKIKEGSENENPLELLRKACVYSLERLVDDDQYQRVYTIVLHKCEKVGDIKQSVERQQQINRETLDVVEQQLQLAQQKGFLSKSTNTRAASASLCFFMLGIFSGWLQDTSILDLKTQANRVINSYFDGLVSP